MDFRSPLAWEVLLRYLRQRAIPGVEHADLSHYRRTVEIDGYRGWVAVSLARSGPALEVDLSPSLAPVVAPVIARIRQLFDLGARPESIDSILSPDPILRDVVKRIPGLRVPGAFDGFELGVRAILGQQVSVRAATTIAGRWARSYGSGIATPFPELDRLTPTVSQIVGVDPGEIAALGIVGARARSIAALASAVSQRQVVLTPAADVDEQMHSLMLLPGIGPWTAQYIAMRALHWPDAFPATDLMLVRAAGMRPRELMAHAESWRPWRAYATHYLWQSLGVTP